MGDAQKISLDWQGPFKDHTDLPSDPGLYAVSGQVYGGTGIQLLYVGEAKIGLAQRWTCQKHRNWLRRCSEVLDARLFFAPIIDQSSNIIVDVESVLIYVHQPNQNSAKLNSHLPPQHYIIENTGYLPPGLLEVIDTAFPWFGLQTFDGPIQT